MSASLASSRDRAVARLRLTAATVVLLGFTGSGALAGLLARQYAEPATPAGMGDAQDGAPRGTQTARVPQGAEPRRVIVMVHRPAAASAPASAPAVTAPQRPVAPAGTSSGSVPS